MLHSYYTMPIILYRGGVPTTYTVRWYKAPVGAKYLGIPSCIFSHVWDNNPGESVPGEVGEVGAPRTWDKGDNRGGYQGQCFRGDPAWFLTGRLPGVLPAPDPSCLCSIPPAVASGGMVLGGAATVPPVVSCGQCPAGAPVVYLVTLSGATGPQAPLNGTHRCTYKGGCTWYFFDPGPQVQITLSAPPLGFGGFTWGVRAQQGISISEYGAAAAWNCLGVNSAWTNVFVSLNGPTGISVAAG